MRIAKAIYSELVTARESAITLTVFGRNSETGEWESLINREKGELGVGPDWRPLA